MSYQDNQTKARGLYELYRDEKKHEDRTKKVLNELERNNEQLHSSKLRLVEKLLDIQVKDELSRQILADEGMTSRVNTELLRENAKRKIQQEVKAHIDEARTMFADGFVSHLDKLANAAPEEETKEVRTLVDQYVDPHIEALRREKRRQPVTPLQSVAVAAAQVQQQKRRELDDQSKLRARKDHSERVKRVQEATKMFKRDVGDLGPLLHVVPTEYRTDIGRREAEVNDLRQLIAQQRAEEERLLQERQLKLSIIDAERAKLSADVDGVCQQLVLQQRELETKEMDLKEMAASQVPGSGSWATNTMQLEKDLSIAVEEEFQLRHESDEVRKTVDILMTEKAALEGEIAESIRQLAEDQNKHQKVLGQIETRLMTEKSKMYKLRDEETEMTQKINELRHRILHRREDVRRQKRDLRAVINTTISQLAIEDRVQSSLMARALELQTAAEKSRAGADHHVAQLNSQLMRINTDLKQKSTQISQFAEQLTNYYAGTERVKEVKLTAVQLRTQIDQLVKEWTRVEWEAASGVAQVASRIDLNTRENERVLRQMGQFVVLQEDLAGESVDIANTSTQELERIRDSMYLESTQRSYREAKYTQCIRMLRERLAARSRGDRNIQPLTRNSHSSLEDRKARREAIRRSRAAREAAVAHIRRYNENAEVNSTYGGQTTTSVPGSATRAASESWAGGGGTASQGGDFPEFRMLVINFIKKEIQPLYDTNQITKRRFIDVVSRVSSWYLETHRPTAELSEQNMNELVRKIRDVLTWQDEERLKNRA